MNELEKSRRRHITVAILANIAAPYRLPIYQALSREFEVRLILSGNEDNRRWENHASSMEVDISYAKGFSIKRTLKSSEGRVYDTRYLHINPGFLTQLIRFSPEAVITNEMGLRSLIALLYCCIFRRNLWIWWGGTTHTERKVGRIKSLIRRRIFAPLTTRWISYGLTSTEYLESIGIKKENILQIQNAVDDSRFSISVEPMAMDLPHPRILVVGQLIGRKGLHQFLAAMELAALQFSDFSMIFVGDGPEREPLLDQAKKIAAGSVSHYAYIPPEEMGSVYRACDFLVFPTLQDVWGLVVNEAILSGLPVLVSKYAGCAREIVPPEQTFDPTDTVAFANLLKSAMQKRLSQPDEGVLLSMKCVSSMLVDDIRQHVGPENGRGGDY